MRVMIYAVLGGFFNCINYENYFKIISAKSRYYCKWYIRNEANLKILFKPTVILILRFYLDWNVSETRKRLWTKQERWFWGRFFWMGGRGRGVDVGGNFVTGQNPRFQIYEWVIFGKMDKNFFWNSPSNNAY